MAVRTVNERIEILEQKVGDLQLLPDRVAAVESQIVQLRTEMRDGFSAMRTRMEEGDEESRRHAKTLHDELLIRVQEGDKDTQRQMRVLHEEVISRIALLDEGRRRKR